MRKGSEKLSNCILCKSRLQPLLRMENMPASAQDIPDLSELAADKGIDLQLCECSHCHLVQLDCEPVGYYKDVIRAGGGSTTMEALRHAQYEEFIGLCHLENKKILEVGCGQGEFLSILAGYPVQSFGIEHKADLVEKARERGLLVERDFQESEVHDFLHAPFDAFTSFNFLEHQPDPVMYLKAIHHNLAEEAYGLITVPSFEYILENASFYEIIRDHIAYYTHESLEYLLRMSGFEVIQKSRVNRDTLAVIVKKSHAPVVDAANKEDGVLPDISGTEQSTLQANYTDISGLLRIKQSIRAEVDDLICQATSQNKTIAIWGASHQGFTLCSTTGLSGRVEYIIDSASFKQGKYAPASHIPIVSPADAVADPVDIIVIVAPGYTKEIAGIIRRDFGEPVEIYSLMSDRLTKLH